MRVLILSINYWPEVTGIGAFTTYRAEALATAGHDVKVCTAFPYYPEWRIAEEYKDKFWLEEEHKGVRIHRSYVYVPRKVTSIRRVLHEASFIVSSLFKALTLRKPDLLLVVSPPLGLAFNAIVLSRLWRIPYVFDVEDLQPDSAAEHNMLPGWILRFLYKVEMAAYRSAAMVTTITAGMRNRILEKGIEAEKVELLEPRMDDALATMDASEGKSFREKYSMGDRFLVTYSGNVGVKQVLDVMVEAAARNHSDATTLFLIVGDGADKERIERLAAEKQLTNVRFLPLLGEEDFRGLLSASDVCIVTQRKSATEIAFPSKVVTYLAAGCAVIASVNEESEVARTVLESGGGIVAEAENGPALLDAVHALKGADLGELRRRAQAYAAKRWSSERVLRNLEQRLLAVSAAGPSGLLQEDIPQ